MLRAIWHFTVRCRTASVGLLIRTSKRTLDRNLPTAATHTLGPRARNRDTLWQSEHEVAELSYVPPRPLILQVMPQFGERSLELLVFERKPLRAG
jgi:hypothetical protein